MADVTNKLKSLVVEDPLGRKPDPWADFRHVEVIELNWHQTYRHSLGKYSRFFLELENERFLATRCPECETVWSPPRPVCPRELAVTEWIELSGRGRLAGYSILHYAPSMAPDLETPYVLAYVEMEGADTLFAHLLRNVEQDRIAIGMPVHVVYDAGPVSHPILLMAFEPLSE